MNPFIREGYVVPSTSMNRVCIPAGQYGGESLTTSIMAFEWLSSLAWKELESDYRLEEQQIAIQHYGNRLGALLVTLHKGFEESKRVRTDWAKEHWIFWTEVKYIVLAGGIASSQYGDYLLKGIYEVLRQFQCTDLGIEISTDAQTLALRGLAQEGVLHKKSGLLFDLGQSYIKRGWFFQGEEVEVHLLRKIPSKYMEHIGLTQQREEELAPQLHLWLSELIIKTYLEVSQENREVDNEIWISIATYTDGHRLLSNSGYYKLRLLSEDYSNFLSQEISGKLKKEIVVHFVHDGTSAALAVEEKGKEKTAVLTLGTALGIGFPNEKIKKKIVIVR